MKKNILTKGLFLLMTLVLVISCNKKEVKSEKKEDPNTFTITGEIKGLGDTNMYFRMPDKTQEQNYRRDSVIVKNNKFSYTGKVDQYELLKFWVPIRSIEKSTPDGGYYPVASNNLLLFVFPGAKVNVQGEISDFVNAYPSGDKANNDLARLHKELFPVLNKGGDLLSKSSFEKDKSIYKIIKDSVEENDKVADKIKESFVKNNLGSAASVWYLLDMMTRSQVKADDAIAIFNKFDSKLSDNTYYKNIQKRIDGINATKDGMPVPEIVTTSTIDGTEFDLKSYRGKYVLIDFWGTWCGPCTGEMPSVKAFAEKHKDQMKVLGVNSGDSKKRMTKFLDKNNYQWQQVLSKRGENEDNFVLKFNVTSFPTKFIIDPKGIIIKKYTGSGEDAFTYLESVFQKK